MADDLTTDDPTTDDPTTDVQTPGYVFVYGTLKPGERNDHVAHYAGTFRAEPAYVDKMTLYHPEPENYPAMVRGRDRIEGMLLHFDDIEAALPVLDELEGCHLLPPEYTRVELTVYPQKVTAWGYLYARVGRLEQPSARYLSPGVWPHRH